MRNLASMDAMFRIDRYSPRAIGLASATTLGEIAADNIWYRTATIDAAWNLLDSRVAQALAAPLSGLQVVETQSGLSARPGRNEAVPAAKIDHLFFDRNFRPGREIYGNQQ